MNKLTNYLIMVSKAVFVIATIPICAAAINYFVSGGSHLVALAWIAIAMACIGVITTWRAE